jgi:hypothetical protein
LRRSGKNIVEIFGTSEKVGLELGSQSGRLVGASGRGQGKGCEKGTHDKVVVTMELMSWPRMRSRRREIKTKERVKEEKKKTVK